MSIGPLRRFVGMLGLLALAPTALMLGLGRIDPTTAALRAVATLLVTVLIGRVAGWWVEAMARGYEGASDTDSDAAAATPAPNAITSNATPQRRRTDRDATPQRRRTDRDPSAALG